MIEAALASVPRQARKIAGFGSLSSPAVAHPGLATVCIFSGAAEPQAETVAPSSSSNPARTQFRKHVFKRQALCFTHTIKKAPQGVPMKRRYLLQFAVAALAALTSAGVAQAQQKYPDRPIKIIVGFPP